jgi:hypothetical protein
VRCRSLFALKRESKSGMAGSPCKKVCSGPVLASGNEGCANGCEDSIDIDSHRLHGGDCGEGDQSNHQRIFDEILTFFPLDQAPHPGIEDRHFEFHLRPFLNELPVHVCLAWESTLV